MDKQDSTGIRSIRPDTPAKLSIATLITVAVAFAGAIWAARGRLADIEFEQRATRSLVGDLPKRDELRALEQRVTSALRRQMKHAILRCPRRAVRADAWMDCQVIFPQPTEE